jgi:hypothetical protein
MRINQHSRGDCLCKGDYSKCSSGIKGIDGRCTYYCASSGARNSSLARGLFSEHLAKGEILRSKSKENKA